jgi:hypothetical protein
MRLTLLARFSLLWVMVFAAAACRGGGEAVAPEAADITMNLSVAPMPPQTGEATLVVTLQDADGNPIDDATVAVRGDMNHAGMVPVEGEASTAVNGDYRVPFEWTMGGDWFVIVTATLSDGTVVEQQFDYTVASDGMGMGDMDGMNMDDMDMDDSGEAESDNEE